MARPAGQRWQDWARAGAVVLLVHVVLLGAHADLGRRVATGPPARGALLTVSVQRLAFTPPVATSDLKPEPAKVTPDAVATPRVRPADPVERPLSTVAQPPPSRPDAAWPDRDANANANANANRDRDREADGDDPPTAYTTRLPPPFRWQYELQRGGRAGTSEIVFERQDGGYTVTWSNRQAGREAHGLSSRGGVDEAGLAPERFADLRRGRERHAANFDRTGGRITYSGPQVEQVLSPGAQDRLSWLVQLPAIVDADPATRAVAGARVRVQVTGARGEAGIWTFVVQGRETAAVAAGTVPDTVHLLREPRRPYDTRVEVWLDPARHHLPVRLLLAPQPAGELLELRLASDHTPGP